MRPDRRASVNSEFIVTVNPEGCRVTASGVWTNPPWLSPGDAGVPGVVAVPDEKLEESTEAVATDAIDLHPSSDATALARAEGLSVSLDGIALKDGERITLTNQTDESNNGVWFVRSLRRNPKSTDADATCATELHHPLYGTPSAREEA